MSVSVKGHGFKKRGLTLSLTRTFSNMPGSNLFEVKGSPSSTGVGADSVKPKSSQNSNAIKLNHMVEESNEELEHELDDLRAMFDEIRAMSESDNPSSTGVGNAYRKGRAIHLEFEQFLGRRQ